MPTADQPSPLHALSLTLHCPQALLSAPEFATPSHPCNSVPTHTNINHIRLHYIRLHSSQVNSYTARHIFATTNVALIVHWHVRTVSHIVTALQVRNNPQTAFTHSFTHSINQSIAQSHTTQLSFSPPQTPQTSSSGRIASFTIKISLHPTQVLDKFE